MVYDFSVDYDAIQVDNIKNIHTFLMKKNNVVYKMFRFIRKIFSTVLSCENLLNGAPLSCISMNNQECKVKPEIMSRTNEGRYGKWYENIKCKCSLDTSICNNKQRENDDKCRCKCK